MPNRPSSRSLIVVAGSGFRRSRNPHRPSDETRQVVVLGLLNGFDLDRIARLIGISRGELELAYAEEIATGVDRILIDEAANLLRLSRQRADLGVALRAGLAVLGARLAAWRVPKDAVETDPARLPIDDMSLEDTEREIARLRAARDAGGSAE